MAWIQPKTDWWGARDAYGVYVGDYFNASDFNRIKNNIEHLREMAIKVYDDFDITDMGADRTPEDHLYADEINRLRDNFYWVVGGSTQTLYGSPLPYYSDNGNTMTFDALNLLERSMQRLYEQLSNILSERRSFTWNFGMKGGVL